MNVNTFEYLLETLRPVITLQTTRLRKPIPPEEQLAITLRFYAKGESYESLMYAYRVSANSISQIVPRVSAAIIDCLTGRFMPFPETAVAWTAITDEYNNRWNFPHCIGAIDGKHITIKRPNNSVSDYYNYKSFYSIILLALVDADYKFIFTSTGTQGRLGDSAIFQDSKLYEKLSRNTGHLPNDNTLPYDDDTNAMKMPFVIVADDAFPLQKHIMKPYAQRGLTDEKRSFNYRLARARRTSENAFGILTQVFRVFFTPMACNENVAKTVTLACCILHNILCTLSRDSYTASNSVDTVVDNGEILNGEWRSKEQTPYIRPIAPEHGRKAAYHIEEIRDYFKEYFQTSGSIPWQFKHIY